MTDNYDDIINLPYPLPSHHAKMSNYQRAAQFASFAALNGHEEAIAETGRLTAERVSHDEDYAMTLDIKLEMLRSILQQRPIVKLLQFVADKKKKGGSYVETTYKVKDIDEYMGDLIMDDNKRININDIYDITIVETPRSDK